MKNVLQNLLIFFALCLCGLVAFQWVRETDLRKNVQGLTDTVHDKMEAIQSLQQTVKRDEAEIQRLDDIRIKLTQTIKTNEFEISSLRKTVEKTANELDLAKQQIEAYKVAVQKANDNILRQNEEIKKQNEKMLELAQERNTVVSNHNELAKKYNDLAEKWNTQQQELAKAATNAPPAPKR
jgi:chromosome segregation ATPase